MLTCTEREDIMKHILLAAALLAAPALACADPIEGLWQTQPDEGAYAQVQIAPCGPAFCGTIVKSFRGGAPIQSPNIGRQIVIDMRPAGDGTYAGKVWRPSNGKTYVGKIALKGDAMKLSGCVLGGLICAGQDWTRLR
jgi:uncharacterized protein (DUF2147 family)